MDTNILTLVAQHPSAHRYTWPGYVIGMGVPGQHPTPNAQHGFGESYELNVHRSAHTFPQPLEAPGMDSAINGPRHEGYFLSDLSVLNPVQKGYRLSDSSVLNPMSGRTVRSIRSPFYRPE